MSSSFSFRSQVQADMLRRSRRFFLISRNPIQILAVLRLEPDLVCKKGKLVAVL